MQLRQRSYLNEKNEGKMKPHKDTVKHIKRVEELMAKLASELKVRGKNHDFSKTISPEVEVYNRMIPVLNKVKYGTPEYKAATAKLGPAWDHHKKNNRHHPEFFENGIHDMNLVDLLEMLCDWRAASERGKGNKLEDSFPSNQKRYKISDQLMSVLKNTLSLVKTKN